MSRRFTLADLKSKGLTVTGDTASKKQPILKPVTRKLGTVDPLIPTRINIKPLSVNSCWKGQRFKTDDYKSYEKELMWLLQPIDLPEKPYKITFEFGFSNPASDFDNCVKPLTDILQKRYGFNDKEIVEAYIVKKIVKQGSEYLEFKIETSKIF